MKYITFRRHSVYLYRIVRPTKYGFSVSEPYPLIDALKQTIPKLPYLLNPPQKEGLSQDRCYLEKIKLSILRTCDGCDVLAIYKGVTITEGKITEYHNLCACCFVIWAQDMGVKCV